jgi:membrane protease YdiL (CAAX protease family)
VILQTLAESIVQLLLFSAVPFVWWLATARKQAGFFAWIGLCAPTIEHKKKTALLVVGIFFTLLAPAIGLLFAFEDTSVLANAKFVGSGLQGLLSIPFYAILQTGLAEEILFRGFLGKRMMKKWGFSIGNAIQAMVFGLLHGVLLFAAVPSLMALTVTSFTAAAGWLMGTLNEKCSGGSIVPSWIFHSVVNILSPLAFLCGLMKI